MGENTKKMEALIEHFLAEAAKVGMPAFEGQLTFAYGPVAGAVKRGPVPGVYQIRMITGTAKKANELKPIDLFFTAETVYSIAVPVDERIVVPNGPTLVPPSFGA